jgi:hypothetical protein
MRCSARSVLRPALACVVALSAAIGAAVACSTESFSVSAPPDAAPPDAAPPDAGPGPDTSVAQGFCPQPGAAFCADFDRDTYDVDWERQIFGGGVARRVLRPDPPSPPAVLESFIPADAGFAAGALRRRILLGATRTVTLSADVRAEQVPNKPDFLRCVSIGGDENAAIHFALLTDGANIVVGDGKAPNANHRLTAATLPTGWFHVELRAELAGAAPTVSLLFDGVNVVDKGKVPSIVVVGPAVNVDVGAFVFGSFGAATFTYDNVRVDAP